MVTAVISLNETEMKILLPSPFFAASFGIHTTLLPTFDLSVQTVTHVPLTMKLKTFLSPYSIVNCLVCNRNYSSSTYTRHHSNVQKAV